MNKAKLAESMAEYCWALLRQDGGGTAAAYGWISRKGGSWNPAALLVAMESVHQGRTRQGCTVTFVKGWAMIQVDAEEEAVPDAAIAVRNEASVPSQMSHREWRSRYHCLLCCCRGWLGLPAAADVRQAVDLVRRIASADLADSLTP